MKLIQYKKYISDFLLGVTIVLCILLSLAICGILSDDKGHNNQNVLGGYGPIKTANRSRAIYVPPFYDEVNIYYNVEEDALTADTLGTTMLYSQNIETGVSQPICQRVLCKHDTVDCPMYHLYDFGFLNYYAIDDKVYYAINYDDNNRKNGYENIVLYEWDIMSDSRESVYEFPSVILEKDEYGTEIEVFLGVGFVERVNKDIILVECGNVIYLFDNDFSLLDSVDIGSGTYIVWTEQTIFWGYSLDFCSYDIESKEVEENIIQKSAGNGKFESSSDKWYCYDDTLYFTSDNMIMAYNSVDKSISEITEISRPTDGEFIQPYQFVIFDNLLYYYFEESIYCINLDTGEQTLMPDMTSVPWTKTDKYLLEWNWQQKQIEVYDFSGRRIR